jgi:hypothetical protein
MRVAYGPVQSYRFLILFILPIHVNTLFDHLDFNGTCARSAIITGLSQTGS